MSEVYAAEKRASARRIFAEAPLAEGAAQIDAERTSAVISMKNVAEPVG